MADVTELRIAITVSDFDAAVSFYREGLGLKQAADWSSAEGRVILLEAGRATLEILDGSQAEYVDRIEAGSRVAGKVRLAVEVQDVDAVVSRLIVAGGDQAAAAVETPWGDRNVRVNAPEGMQLTLFASS